MLPNLKLLRRGAGISQQKLADILGISQQSVNQYENRDVEPDIGTLTRIADYFDTSIDYIVGHSTDRWHKTDNKAFYLNEEESAVIDQYRALTPKERQCVAQVIDTLADH